MNKFAYIYPRQTGKTTFAIHEFRKSPHDTLYITPDSRMIKALRDHFKLTDEELSNFYSNSSDFFINQDGGVRYNKIILDEYLFFSRPHRIREFVMRHNPSELIIFSTPDTQFNGLLFDFICKFKNRMLYHSDRPNDFMKSALFIADYFKISKEELHRYMFNFLTDEDTKIFTIGREKVPEYLEKKANHLTERQVQTEILGKYKYDFKDHFFS